MLATSKEPRLDGQYVNPLVVKKHVWAGRLYWIHVCCQLVFNFWFFYVHSSTTRNTQRWNERPLINFQVHEMSHCLKCPLSYVDWGHGEHMANSTFSDLSRVSVMCSWNKLVTMSNVVWETLGDTTNYPAIRQIKLQACKKPNVSCKFRSVIFKMAKIKENQAHYIINNINIA